MSTILSNKLVVEDTANKIHNYSAGLVSETIVLIDSQSTLSGSIKAVEVINSENTISGNISNLLINAANKINSVCLEFQKKDAEIGKELNTSNISSKGFSINGQR